MVRLTIPPNAICPEFRGSTIDIGIRIQDSTANAPEYPFDDGSTNKCYIESQLDKQYIIDFYITNNNRLSDPEYRLLPGCIYLKAEVHIDGKWMNSPILCQQGCSQIFGKVEASYERPFVFSAPTLVRDGGLLDKKDVDQLGTIVVKLWPIQLNGSSSYSGGTSNSNSSTVNEKAKKGVFISATTKLGAPDTTYVPKFSKSIKLTNEPLLIHTFHYKTREFLELEGIIPEPRPAPAARNDASNPAAPIIPNVKPEPVKVKSERSSYAGVGTGSSTNSQKRTVPDMDSEVEYLGQTTPKKRVVDVIDLTLD
ncbi:hypothetical protein BCR33DRAFT_771394 [Rhizoclosmatium globosum]|uniref:DUF7918 domain-containing protein n=1 Tax=Rhizoclosmatium globosum TaxID=329046 RepID=A0A1Y2BE84_9FUNG|nr:hypothetical protein BCR33DRAFT_771394 [Rhizoclosmatium globosum]|eukprot:ORY32385.1 hypothetical protein BCR33DRAFT_771394 [Rhizoclosmatium globosum]